ESMLLSFLAFLLALIMTGFGLPYLNDLTGLEIVFQPFSNFKIIMLFTGIFLAAGLLAGLYPAFFVSRFQAVSVLKGQLSSSQKPWNEWLRKGLISVQFLAAIVFISGALTLYLQLQHLRSQPMGFDQELTLALPLNSSNNINSLFRPGDAEMRGRMNTFDESLLSNPNIKAVTQCSHMPGLGAVGRKAWSDQVKEEDNLFPRTVAVDYDFVETFGLEILEGRDFNKEFGTDHISSFLVNEKAMKALGWETPAEAVGGKMNLEGKEGTIIGILKDYNYQSLRSAIEPLVLEVRPGTFGFFGVQMENANVPATLAFIEEKWKTHFPEKVFEYNFLDDSLQSAYEAESRLSSIIGYFAFLAIFIACFGLFGLAAMLTQQRFKEIGIRKVLGASVGQILQLISRDFLILIAVAMLLAAPISWLLLRDWLSDFAYRINFPWWTTLLSGLVVM
ncbi:MAG: FtsX-like permease family protein, partial [Bacteroidota bacterium]